MKYAARVTDRIHMGCDKNGNGRYLVALAMIDPDTGTPDASLAYTRFGDQVPQNIDLGITLRLVRDKWTIVEWWEASK